MENEVRSDAELLHDLCNDPPLVIDRVTGRTVVFSRKTIARWTGLSIKTISDYAVGKYNIPVDFWRRVLDHHMDVRIVSQIIPADGCFEILFHKAVQPDTSREFFKEALALEKKHHELMTYICDILADGRVDELDAQTVERYNDAFHNHRQLDTRMHRAILDKFSQVDAS